MKRYRPAVCLAFGLGLAACEPTAPPRDSVAEDRTVSQKAEMPASGENNGTAIVPVVPGAPAFAVVYPGGVVQGDPVVAAAGASAGGIVTYVTDANPDTVIAFHREKAEAAGLASVTAMNQGDARAYGAAKDLSNLQVVASPIPESGTSVQLSWTLGS